jgi:hypothetical protein
MSPQRFPHVAGRGEVARARTFRNVLTRRWRRFRFHPPERKTAMHQAPAGRGCLAGLIGWKLGGGIFSAIVIALIAYWLLGQAHC